MMPQILHEIADDQGNTVTSFPPVPVRQVITGEVAKQMRKALQSVVSPKGTAPLAQISGYPVAGKTGTAQKIDPHGGYMSGKYIVSFCGFFPAENPEVVGFVMLDEAVTKPEQNYGGMVAAPIFSRIGEKAARYLNLVPQPEPLPNKLIVTQRERD
jgi:cell division protein FtsI/penicillin-binding protein 2